MEEQIAMSMFKRSKRWKVYSYIGKIIDYQNPLKAKSSDVGGKMDLLSWNKEINKVYILKLKKADIKEIMLRCVLEGYTYMRTINKQKLFESFEIPSIDQLVARPFVSKESFQAKESQEDRLILKKLMILLDSKPFYITEDFKVEVAQRAKKDLNFLKDLRG